VIDARVYNLLHVYKETENEEEIHEAFIKLVNLARILGFKLSATSLKRQI